jgi:transposase
MAWTGGERLRRLVARLATMIRVDALWLSTTPLDMRAGTETILARVVSMFGEARPHHAYLFANRRANRMKVLVHDGYGIWLASRRLNQGRFCWRHGNSSVELTRAQFDALVLGLPWERLADGGVIRIV